MEIYDYLLKISDDDINIESYELPDGYVTDGFGNLYLIPKEGKTPYIYVDIDNDKYAYNYSWVSNTINVFYVYTNSTGDYEYVFIGSDVIPASDFIDNPEYWFYAVIEKFQDVVSSELDNIKTTECINMIKENIDDDSYKYEIVVEVETEGDADHYNGVMSILLDYDFYTNLYNQQVYVKAQQNNFGMLTLHIESPFALDKEDLIEIFNDYEEYIKVQFDKINLNIIDAYQL